MSTSKETGHQVNTENLDQMIVILKGFGTTYNPSNREISIPLLEQILSKAKSTQSRLHEVKQPHTAAANARNEAFLSLPPLVTRSLNALLATKTSAQTDESAKALVHKIKGEKIGKKAAATVVATQDASQVQAKEKSTAQLGFDDQLQNFDQFIKLLEITPQYIPNEVDIKVDSLKTYFDDLAAKNHTVIEAEVAVNNARIARNEVLYKPLTGVYDISFDVKAYVKSIYGATSPQFRQISKLKFSPLKK